MRIWLVLLLLTAGTPVVQAQSDSSQLMQLVRELDQALIKQDTVALDRLLDKNLLFGHSNGWVQTKQEVLQDFGSGKVQYLSMESSEVKLQELSKSLATITLKLKAAGRAGEKEFQLDLHVLQVWKKDKKGWQLYVRQGARL
ncbi:MAG: nuclear transport factor 2 family protein [Chitinophagaceae bacterium]